MGNFAVIKRIPVRFRLILNILKGDTLMILFPFNSINLSKNIKGTIERVTARMNAPKITVISDTTKKLTINVEING